jgi:molybdopterin-guanine dinucleotide biosynthesis protein A
MTGAVLAGGGSTRMGRNKALLELGGMRLIERVIRAIRPLFAEVAIVANDPEPYADLKVPVWPDRIAGKATLGGICTAVSRSAFPQAFCIACDMPFPSAAMITFLRDLAPGWDVVVPHTADGYHPVHAVYSKTCIPHMEAMIAADRLKIDRLFPAVRLRAVEEPELRVIDPTLRCFVNVNTPADLETASRLIEDRND